MPVVNDFPGLYERITQQATQLANSLGIQPEIIIQYFNDTAHFPQTLDELNRWGDTPDPTYGFRRRQPNGVWTPLMQGDTPGTGGANDPGFKHIIANEVGKVQRFQQVDPSGNVFGGSWDPAYNAAHPGGGPGVAAGGTTRSAQGTASAQTTGRGAQGTVSAQGVDTSSPAYQAANPSGQPRNDAVPPDPPSGTPAAGGGGGTPTGADTGTAAGGGGTGFSSGGAAAANAAVLAFLAKRRLEEVEIPDLKLRTETELARMRRDDALAVWKKAYETATLTGKMPDGSSTMDYDLNRAKLTGYTGGASGKGQAVMDAIAALRTNPQYQAADGATRRQMEAAAVSQATGLDLASAAAGIDRLRALSAQTGQPSSAALVESVLMQTPGGKGTITPDYEKQQNDTAIAALTLLSNLRGPENAFAYSDTLAGLPESVRANIQAAMGRLPFTASNPAQRGVLGDVGALGAGQPPAAGGVTQPGMPGAVAAAPPAQAEGMMNQSALPPATGPRTAQQQALQSLPAPEAAPGTPQYQEAQMALQAQQAQQAQPPAAPFGSSTPPGFFPSMTNTNPITPPPFAGGNPAGGNTGPGMAAPLYGPRTQPIRPATAAGMTLPGQLSPTDWNNTSEYQRKLLLAGYEHAGEDINNVQDEYKRSLPKAYGPRTGRLRAA